MRCYINRDAGHAAPRFVLHITRNNGFSVEHAIGDTGSRYLCFVIWYRRSAKRLGYFYPSFRYF